MKNEQRRMENDKPWVRRGQLPDRFSVLSSRFSVLHFSFGGWGALLLALTLGLAVVWAPDCAAQERGKVTVETTVYKNWRNNIRLSNGDAELIVTLDVGPRIISYRLVNGPNVFKEYIEQLGKNGEKEWQIRGGHRLWVAPEDTTRTYAPDNGLVACKEIKPGLLRFTPAPETKYGIQKELDIRLELFGTGVTVVHRIKNVGKTATELAPWALSVMAPGGIEIIPLPPKKPHPGSAAKAKSAADFAPNQSLALWSYFDFKDPRYTFGSKYLTLRQDPKRGPTKLGLAHRMGWVGYLNKDTLFVKRIEYQEGEPYPDNGCNFETFTNEDMLEIESLGPLVELAPGEQIEHTEHWELVWNVEEFKDEKEIDQKVLSKVKSK